MPAIRQTPSYDDALERTFEDVAASWGLSVCEREAVRGSTAISGRLRPLSSFVTKRMALVIAIAGLLAACMMESEVRLWPKRLAAGVSGTSPLDDMLGSTDRLRRIREMLRLEAQY